MMEREAHYTQGKQPTLSTAITRDGRRAWIVLDRKVAGKREARQVAKQYGAMPWNF